MQFMLLFSRQGKLRLQKWYVPLSDKEKKKITRELVQTVLARKPKMCSFLEWRDLKIVYKRWILVSSSPFFPSLSLTPSICAHRYQSWACDTVLLIVSSQSMMPVICGRWIQLALYMLIYKRVLAVCCNCEAGLGSFYTKAVAEL